MLPIHKHIFTLHFFGKHEAFKWNFLYRDFFETINCLNGPMFRTYKGPNRLAGSMGNSGSTWFVEGEQKKELFQ